MITSLTGDPRKVYRKNLADTSVHTLVDCASKEVKTLESMAISCGTATTFSLIYNDGTTDYYIYNTLAMLAHTTVFITDFHPQLHFLDGAGVSQRLKVQAGAADEISVVAVMIDHLPVKENRNLGFTGTGGANVGWRGP